MYSIHRNPRGSGVYNFQTKRGKFIQLDTKYSSNRYWKNKFFFISEQWEFTSKEKAVGPRVSREMNLVFDLALKEPILTVEETKRVNDVIQWSQTHESFMFSNWLDLIPRLSEFVYDVKAFVVPRRPAGATARLLVDSSPPTANTQGATPRKEQAQVASKGKLRRWTRARAK